MKLLIALALAAPSGLAMGPYVPGELNGCGDPCADIITLDDETTLDGTAPNFFFFAKDGDNKCYEVGDTFPIADIVVPEGVKCAKITVPSGISLGSIDQIKRGINVRGDKIEVVNEGEVGYILVQQLESKITNTGIIDSLSGISVFDTAVGTKITNTGTKSDGGPINFSVQSATTELTVSDPGKAAIFATEDITFQCYDAPVTVDAGKFVFCPEINNKYVEFAGDCVDGEGQYTFNANCQSVPTNPTGPPDQSVPGFGTYEDCKSRCDLDVGDCKAFVIDSTKAPENACVFLWTVTLINPTLDFASGNTNPIEGGDGNPERTCYKKD